MNFRKFAERAKYLARMETNTVLRHDGDITPHFLVNFSGDTPYWGALPDNAFADDTSKDLLVSALAVLTHQMKPDKLALVHPIFYAKIPVASLTKAEHEAYRRDGRRPDSVPSPSQHPDRVEALAVTVFDREIVELWLSHTTRSTSAPVFGPWENANDVFAGGSRTAFPTGRFVDPLREAMR